MLGALGTALVAHVLSHDLTFLLAYGSGYRGVLGRTGHDERWSFAMGIVLALAVCLAVVAALRILWLQRVVGGLDARSTRSGLHLSQLFRQVLPLWAVVVVLAAGIFVLQENLEHLRLGVALPGAGVLFSGSAGPLGVIAIVSLAVAFVGALFRWYRDELVARIDAARRRWPTTGRVVPRPVLDADRAFESILGRRGASRAPPRGLPIG